MEKRILQLKITFVIVLCMLLSTAYPQVFTLVSGTGFTPMHYGDMEWGDYNNDGNLDFIHTGSASSSSFQCRIYTNNGDGTFTVQPGMSVVGAAYCTINWADYDNDNDLDYFIAGTYGIGFIYSKLFRNMGSGVFQEQTGINLTRDRMALQRLKEASEKAKCELSTLDRVEIRLPFIAQGPAGPQHLEATLTREMLESMVSKI